MRHKTGVSLWRRVLALLIPFGLARRIVRGGRVIEYFKWFFDKRNIARGGGGGLPAISVYSDDSQERNPIYG